jgi:ribose 5-phosphate isomerase RpiB
MCREVRYLSIQHNDANICIISTDCIGERLAADLIYNYLISGFDGELKNKVRLGLIEQF